MSRTYSNLHHGVPRSFAGSYCEENLSILETDKHADFHQKSGHLPPCFFQRKLILASIDWKNPAGASLPVSFIRDSLTQLMQHDWRTIYVPQSIRPPNKYLHEEQYCARASVNLNNQLYHEQFMTADDIDWLMQKRHPRPESRSFRNNITQFFGETNPAEAMNRYLTDRTGNGDYKWTKPMQPMIRSQLRRILRNVTPEPLKTKGRNMLLEYLELHRKQLRESVTVWEPNTRDFTTVIKQAMPGMPLVNVYT